MASNFQPIITLIFAYLLQSEENRRPVHASASVVRVPTREKKALGCDWDGWPNGTFELEFTFEEVEAYNNLQVHWATKSHGVRGGNDSPFNSTGNVGTFIFTARLVYLYNILFIYIHFASQYSHKI